MRMEVFGWEVFSYNLEAALLQLCNLSTIYNTPEYLLRPSYVCLERALDAQGFRKKKGFSREKIKFNIQDDAVFQCQ